MTTAVRPQPTAPREYHFPRFERHCLDNGLSVVVAPVHALPLVTVVAVSEAGAAADPRGREGVARLTAHALNEGTPRFDGEALTDYLEQLGTSVAGTASWDAATLGMTVLRAHLERALPHFVEVLTTPTFPEAAIQRLVGERVAEILQVESEPRELADERFDEYLYEQGSRYQRPLGGTRATVEAITRDDVVAFHRARYQPQGTTIVVAGDIAARDAVRMVRDAIGGWQGTAPAPVAVDATPARTTPSVHIVPRSDAPQSELRLGHVGVSRATADYFPIVVMNAILGGLFSSRINLNLREAHGYTYGASSAFDWRRVAGPFVIGAAVASDVTAAAIQETLTEIERMRAEPPSESELSLATSYLDGVFPIRYETTAAIAGALAGLVIYGLPDDWYDTYRPRIRAVTVEDVHRAAREYVHPERLQIVIVGDAAAIREPVDALGVGAVMVATPS